MAAGAGGAKAAAVAAAQTNPPKPPLWVRRVQNLPAFLASTNRDRFVPPDLIAALQADLLAIATRLKPPPSWALAQFNRQLRATIPHPSAREQDIAGLNVLFGRVLTRANAPPEVVAKFQQDMLALAAVDSIQRNPAQTVAADYGMILQMCMGVGLVKPTTPKPATPARGR
jgi:hypothetical protein